MRLRGEDEPRLNEDKYIERLEYFDFGHCGQWTYGKINVGATVGFRFLDWIQDGSC